MKYLRSRLFWIFILQTLLNFYSWFYIRKKNLLPTCQAIFSASLIDPKKTLLYTWDSQRSPHNDNPKCNLLSSFQFLLIFLGVFFFIMPGCVILWILFFARMSRHSQIGECDFFRLSHKPVETTRRKGAGESENHPSQPQREELWPVPPPLYFFCAYAIRVSLCLIFSYRSFFFLLFSFFLQDFYVGRGNFPRSLVDFCTLEDTFYVRSVINTFN